MLSKKKILKFLQRNIQDVIHLRLGLDNIFFKLSNTQCQTAAAKANLVFRYTKIITSHCTNELLDCIVNIMYGFDVQFIERIYGLRLQI